MSDNWSVDLPGWEWIPDPEFFGEVIWLHLDYEGVIDVALCYEGPPYTGLPTVGVVEYPIITENEVDGCHLGSFDTWDDALEFALQHSEIKDGE